jgi:hypothetical protein
MRAMSTTEPEAPEQEPESDPTGPIEPPDPDDDDASEDEREGFRQAHPPRRDEQPER